MIFTIAAKELKGLFASPLAWIVLAVVQVIGGYAFLRRLDDYLQIQPQLATLSSAPSVTEMVAAPLFGTVAALVLFAVPVLAMRLIAEERLNQTMVLLMSAPISMTEIVIGKFLGLTAFLFGVIALTVLMPLSLAGSARLDYGLLAALVLGLALLVAGFVAVSLYISCLTVHPVVAAVAAFGR
jgi:ABC-2 type transport system permease protein